MTESQRITIVGGDGSNKVADIVESTEVTGVYGVVLLKANGNSI